MTLLEITCCKNPTFSISVLLEFDYEKQYAIFVPYIIPNIDLP